MNLQDSIDLTYAAVIGAYYTCLFSRDFTIVLTVVYWLTTILINCWQGNAVALEGEAVRHNPWWTHRGLRWLIAVIVCVAILFSPDVKCSPSDLTKTLLEFKNATEVNITQLLSTVNDMNYSLNHANLCKTPSPATVPPTSPPTMPSVPPTISVPPTLSVPPTPPTQPTPPTSPVTIQCDFQSLNDTIATLITNSNANLIANVTKEYRKLLANLTKEYRMLSDNITEEFKNMRNTLDKLKCGAIEPTGPVAIATLVLAAIPNGVLAVLLLALFLLLFAFCFCHSRCWVPVKNWLRSL